MNNKAEKGAASRFAGTGSRTFLVAVLIFLLAILTLEVVLRATHFLGARTSWAEPDPVIGWRFTPSRPYWFIKENDHPIEGRINSMGWRDRERELGKHKGTYRIAVLGDSYVAGFDVELDSTFVAITEKRLTRDFGLDVELMNFGRQGATQTEEYLILKRDVAPTKPDMVMLLLVPQNDISDVSRRSADGLLRPFYEVSDEGRLVLDTRFTESPEYKWKTAINPMKQRSALLSLIADRYNALRKAQRQSALHGHGGEDVGIRGYLSLCTQDPESLYVENYRLNKYLIRAIADYCGEHGVEFLLVCGDLATEREDERRYKALDATFDPDFFDNDLRAFSDSLGIDYLGLQRPFTRYIRSNGRRLHWVHWNYAGHRVAAEALTLKLRDTLLERRGDS